jgi:SAM-dependent methyltransferase
MQTQPTSDRGSMTASRVFEPILVSHYSAERAAPQRGQLLYLHLSDLAVGLSRFRSDARMKVLDFGCGSSPYRNLFPNADYRRADAIDAPDLDYEIGADESIAEESGVFDVILSTQVLEHVGDPARYLSECHRLLGPGGRLIISTHGIYEDHGLPYDFRRWTADGLRTDLERAGFDVAQCYRLTTNGRAMAFLLEQHGGRLIRSRRHMLGLAFWCLHSIISWRRRWFHMWCDSALAASRVVDYVTPGHTLAIGLLCLGVKRG